MMAYLKKPIPKVSENYLFLKTSVGWIWGESIFACISLKSIYLFKPIILTTNVHWLDETPLWTLPQQLGCLRVGDIEVTLPVQVTLLFQEVPGQTSFSSLKKQIKDIVY